MDSKNSVWAVGCSSEKVAALCEIGRRIGGHVEAVIIGASSGDGMGARLDADVVRTAVVPAGGLAEDCVPALISAIEEDVPAVLLFPTDRRMRLIAARIAAAMGVQVLNDVLALEVDDDGALTAEHMMFGGKAMALERVVEGPAVVLVSEGMLSSEPTVDATVSCPAAIVLPVQAGASGMKLVERKPRGHESVDLAAARRVVSVGRGVDSSEDLALAEEFARVLEAEIGCTRPVAEGAGLMPRERYIGVSGAMLKPDLFVAVGLSGQIQHMVGANRAKTIVAINKDKNAPIFKQCDYGIVGDLREIVPKLSAALAR